MVVLLIAGAVDELRDALAVHGRQSTDAFGPDGAELGNEVGRRKGDGGGGGSRGAAGKAELTHCVDGGDQLVVGVAEVLVGKAQLGVRQVQRGLGPLKLPGRRLARVAQRLVQRRRVHAA